MKRKLLLMTTFFVAGALGLTVSAQQWNPSVPAGGGEYYLYNVGKGGFLYNGGNTGGLSAEPVSGQRIVLEADATSGGYYINTSYIRSNYMVENDDYQYVYIDVDRTHEMNAPWLFQLVEGKENVYNIVISATTVKGATKKDAGRRLEFDSRNNGTNSAVLRSTRQSSAGGALTDEYDQWMLVTPAEYELSKARRPYLAAKACVLQIHEESHYTENEDGAHTTFVTAITSAIASGDAATTAEEYNTATTALVTATKEYISKAMPQNGYQFEITHLMTNPDFLTQSDGWTATYNGGAFNHGWDCNEFINNTFDINQSIADMPVGTYKLTVQAFQRQDGSYSNTFDKTTYPVTALLYVNSTTAAIKALSDDATATRLSPNAETRNNLWMPSGMYGARKYFDTGYYVNEVAASVEDGTLVLGFKNETLRDDTWTIFDNFHLYYTGNDLSGFKTRYDEAITSIDNAVDELTGMVPASVITSLNALKTTYDDTSYNKASQYESAINAINEAVTAALNTKLKAPYAAFIQMKDAVEVILAQTNAYTPDTEKETALRAAAATAQTKADAAEDVATVDEAATDVRSAIVAFVKATNIAGKYFDLTSLIENPGFEEGRNTGWNYSYDHTGAFNWITRDGFHCVEFFNCTYDLNQTLTGMPAGYYKVTVNGHYRPNNEYAPAEHLQENVDGYLYLTNGTPVQLQVLRYNVTSITTVHNSMNAGDYLNTAKSYLDEDGDLTFGIKCESQRRTFSWTLIDDFKLYYTVADIDLFLTPYNEALNAAEAVDQTQKMNAEVKSTLQAAIAADTSLDKTNPSALQSATTTLTNATAAANVSIVAYAEAATAVTRIQTEMANTNVVTAAATATLQEKIEAYNNGTLTDDDASALMRRTFRDGTNNDNNTIDDYLLSAWKDGETQMENKVGKLYVNTWSTEADVPGFERPFYEFADGWTGSTVPHTFKATVSNLDAGDYKVEIWVRTQIAGNPTAEPNNITLNVNGGPAVKVVGEVSGNFRHGHYTVYGEVPDESDGKGDLVLTLDIPSHTTGTWLSFKNVKYTKIDVDRIILNETDTEDPSASELAYITLNRTLKADVWNTLTVPFNMEILTGWTVKKLVSTTNSGDNITLNFEDAESIEAGVPYMVKVGASDVTSIAPETPVTIVPTLNNVSTEHIIFKGNFAKLADPGVPTGSYVISNNVFYVVEEGYPVGLNGYRAYLEPVSSGSVKAISYDFGDDATGITNITELTEKAETGAIYNINGQRINTLQKGINIVNGKKVLVK